MATVCFAMICSAYVHHVRILAPAGSQEQATRLQNPQHLAQGAVAVRQRKDGVLARDQVKAAVCTALKTLSISWLCCEVSQPQRLGTLGSKLAHLGGKICGGDFCPGQGLGDSDGRVAWPAGQVQNPEGPCRQDGCT